MTWFICNSASGSYDAQRCDALADALGATRRITIPDDPMPDAAAARREGAERIAIFTGDGTVSSAVEALEGWDGELLILPGGTMNLLSRKLHGDATPEDIIARLPQATARTMPILKGAGLRSLVGVIAGPTSAWGDVREAVRLVLSLQPRPGDSLLPERNAAVVPDVVAWHADGQWKVALNPATSRRVSINSQYEQALADSGDAAPALREIARVQGFDHVETLTGFKWISRAPRLVFGYEEALGYLVDPDKVKDKDGISAAVAVLSLFSELRAAGETLETHLDRFALEFGAFASAQISIRVADLAEIPTTMARLRAEPPTSIGGLAVEAFTTRYVQPSGDRLRDGLAVLAGVLFIPINGGGQGVRLRDPDHDAKPAPKERRSKNELRAGIDD